MYHDSVATTQFRVEGQHGEGQRTWEEEASEMTGRMMPTILAVESCKGPTNISTVLWAEMSVRGWYKPVVSNLFFTPPLKKCWKETNPLHGFLGWPL